MICCWRPRGLCTNSLLLFTHNNNKNNNINNDNVLCSLLHDKAANETNVRPPFAYPDDQHQHRLLLAFIFFPVYWVSLLFVGIALVVVFVIVVVVVVLAWSFIYNICMLLSSFVSPHSPGFARSLVRLGLRVLFCHFFRAVAFSCQPSIVSSSRDENGACFFHRGFEKGLLDFECFFLTLWEEEGFFSSGGRAMLLGLWPFNYNIVVGTFLWF